ncbi:nucleotide sugar dehydrogenase [Candidatus Omnitrophota bacterium]
MNKAVAKFQRKIRQKNIKIAVVGLGYVGLPLAYEFAAKGCCVYGIDLDKDRVNSLKERKSYITDLTSRSVSEVIGSGNLKVSTDFRVLKDIDVVFVCVPTPLKRKYQPNISYIISAVKSIARNFKRGSLVILESTTYPGTTEEVILPIFRKQGHRPPNGIYLCFSPERIDPGNKTYPLKKIPKVIGGINPESTRLGTAVYGIILKRVFPVSSARVAETVKLLENTFRLINIGLIDEMAMMAHKMGIDIWEVIEAAKTKPFGFMPFYPSAGVGGHCIPKDPLYLYWKARHFGFAPKFIKLASKLTTAMPEYITKRLKEVLAKRNKPLAGSRILVIGVTYKKDVRDLRKSPALDVIDILQTKRAKVSYYDPIIPYLKFMRINLKSIKFSQISPARFDCVVIATNHSSINYRLLLQKSSLIFDTHNVYAKSRDKKIIRL